MPLVVEKKIQRSLKEVSRQMGIGEKELVDRALLLYLESAKKILAVEKEFEAWDTLSDESLVKLVKRLPSKIL